VASDCRSTRKVTAMQGTTSNVGCMVAIVLLVGGIAMGQGEDLATDPNGYDNWKGQITVTGPVPGYMEVLAVNIEFCVYQPGQFALSYPGQDPSGGAHWVYAYQVFNNIDPHPAESLPYDPDYVSRISIGLDADENAQGCYAMAGTGIMPDAPDVLAPTSTQAGWDFTQMQMAWSPGPDPAPAISAVLYFTSPYGPELDSTTVSGWQPGAGQLPSPLLPEPTTAAVILVGMIGLSMRTRKG